MSITSEKKRKRAEAGLHDDCGKNPCECRTSTYLPKRKGYKRGKRRFGRNDAGTLGTGRAVKFLKIVLDKR